MTDEQVLQLANVYDAMCAYEKGVPLRIHHFVKVHSFARQIGLREGMDDDALFLLELAALCHDIGIEPALEQFGSDAGPLQERLGPPIAQTMLSDIGVPQKVIDRVCFLIGHHHTYEGIDGLDWQILLEADFLVNMIEGNKSQEVITSFRDKVFKTKTGVRLLEQIRPAS